jgi:hypothetical protein
MAEALLGTGNGVAQYLELLLVYAALFVVIRYANDRVELNFRRTYWILFFGWGVATFLANYGLYRAGWMSFLPWVNNFLHTFVWIGLCLGFLYAGAYRRPWWEKFLLFATFSFIVKVAERLILGTWELPYFFFAQGNLAYLIGWSLLDGLYPALSELCLRIIGRFVRGVVTP